MLKLLRSLYSLIITNQSNFKMQAFGKLLLKKLRYLKPENKEVFLQKKIPSFFQQKFLNKITLNKTLPNLIHCIKEDEKSLENISYKNSKGQLRKISKTALSNVVKYLKI